MKRIVWLTIGVFFLCCSPSLAEDENFNFETTSEGIVEKLSGEKKAPKTRSLPKEEGWSNAFESDGPEVKPGVKTRGLTRSFKVVRKDKGKEVWETVVAPEQRTGNYVNLKIEFDVNSYAIRPQYLSVLNEVGKALNDPRLKDRELHINGHTDSSGPEDYNLKLSMNRAQAVKEYLVVQHQIPAERLIVYGYGESMPLKPNDSFANKQLNRRVEIVADE